MDVRLLILSLFFLVSCMPTATVSNGNIAGSATTGGSSSGSGTSTLPVTPVRWNFLGKVVTEITVNVSNLNNAYIVGTPVEQFLSNSANSTDVNYCVITNFSVGGVRKELRTRAVPISYYDFSAKRTIRVLRVDFSDVANSATSCPATTLSRVLSGTGALISDPLVPALSNIKNDPSQICSNCSSVLTATSVRLSKSTATSLDQVSLGLVDVSDLTMLIDPNYSVSSGAGSCSASVCQQMGFDCCLENQCVKDGTAKPAAYTSQYASLFQTAEQERIINPLSYMNYPQIYYICGNISGSTGSTGGSTSGSTSGTTNTGTSDLEVLKKDYTCIEYLKANTSVSPFHTQVLSTTYTSTTNCLTDSADSAQTYYYQNVLKRLYQRCGCNRTDLSDAITNCPNYEYVVTTKDSTGTPTRIDCYTPPVNSGSIPLQQSVTVSSRSVPHRFFNGTNGAEGDPSQGITQEGSEFSYLDDGKLLPSQQNFSMNAILGQMSVSLNQALPAKVVNVELDQVYLLATTSGYYTPCPSCGKDSWLSSFTAFPQTAYGTGLQATGHTTERDSFGTNTTSGNYEDTIFGRACWLPPTMIPFSHSAKSTVQAQRLARLETQAALFVNGYQRDWFGFNKGALIGSFDGVTWFAIGKGRIVRSTSKKLFLAINAPFADVAAPTMHVVNVVAYDGMSQAAQYDYDPQYHQNHPYQNEAGNCQKFHLCSTDKDCIAGLGWEYMCADMKDVTTNWPEFDSNGNEKANVSNNVTLDQILQQKKFPSASTKRCVYRGAGAVCHSNIGNYSTTDMNKKKVLSCAPNFYCANVNTAAHNTKIARYAALLEDIPVARNHLIGKDANVLGRPLDYMSNQSLSSTARSSIIDNLDAYEPTLASYSGICQPGKKLPDATNVATMMNPFQQMMASDTSKRADYISQIGSCNSNYFSSARHTSCPVLDSNGDYKMFTTTFSVLQYPKDASSQNACGLESLLSSASLASPADTLLSSSPFRNIEAKPLNSQIIIEPTFARDACFRRAGSVCHTDLDCSPNKFHATQVDFFATTFFGNNAERNYWSESLVCGQLDPKPMPSDAEAYKAYDMSKNRCCREIGKDLTTYTAYVPTKTTPGNYDPATDLDLTIAPGSAPNNPKRYSRLAVVEDLNVTKPLLSAFQDRSGSNLTFKNGVNVNTTGQWKTLGEANSETCCGGGWVRKFADGTNDWTKRDRLQLDVSNFRCINSRSVLLTTPEDVGVPPEYNDLSDVTSLVSSDYSSYCKDVNGTNGGCAQYSIFDSTLDIPNIIPDAYPNIIINTIEPQFPANPDYYFMPMSGDGDSRVTIDYNSTSARRNIVIKLPSYVTREFDTAYNSIANGQIMPSAFRIRLKTTGGVTATSSNYCLKDTTFNPTTITDVPSCGGDCCFSYDSATRRLKIGGTTTVFTASGSTFYQKKVGLELYARAPGKTSAITRTSPGSNSYYLRRLGRLELIGIPQINYEVLTCNDNANRIIPGIFLPTKKFYGQFSGDTNFSFVKYYTVNTSKTDPTQVNPSFPGYFTNMYGLQHEAVFSPNDFKCCAPLGKTVTDATKCCTGYGVADASGTSNKKTCALPSGTDLHVYFNRFVTNEGRGTDAPGGGLVDTDFEDQTGEPKIGTTISDKIRALGIAYCSSGKVRQGGAFGWYEPEPQGLGSNTSTKMYNIVDSSRDNGSNANAGSTSTTGYNAFTDGFRWNHHLYCDD